MSTAVEAKGISKKRDYAYVQLGQLRLDDNKTKLDHEEATLNGEFDDLPFFTAGIQRYLWGETFRLGYDAGAAISWQNDNVTYSGVVSGGSIIQVNIDNQMFAFAPYLGTIADINIKEYFRFFVSTGPMIALVSIDQDSDNIETQLTDTVTINGSEKEIAAGGGWYGSAGFVFSFDQYTEIGFAMRKQSMNINFSSNIVEPSYDGIQYVFSIGYKM